MRALFNGNDLDVAPEDLPAFTYELDGADDLSAIRGSRSTTVKLPASQRNRTAMGGWSADEDSPTAGDFAVLSGTAELFSGRGFVRQRGADGYELFALGTNAKWITLLKDKKLSDAGFGVSDPITVYNINATWTDEESALYFPLIDYGALENRNLTDSDVLFDWVRPGIRLRPFLSRVFANQGFALEAKGGFARLFPKLVCPNTNTEIVAGDPANNGAEFSRTTFTQVLESDGFVQMNFDVVVSDPSNGYNNNGRFTTDFSGRMNVFLRNLELNSAGVGICSFAFCILHVDTGEFVSSATVQTFGTDSWSGDLDLGTFDCVLGNTYAVQVAFSSSAIGVGGIGTSDAEWTLSNIRYTNGTPVSIDDCAPDLGAIEALKGVCSLFNVVPITNGRTVELWYYDEVRGTGAEVDLRGRLTKAPRRVGADKPEAFLFLHERDDKDRLIEQARTEGGPYSAGDYRMEMGGWDKPQKIDCPFASTAMVNILADPGGILTPFRIPAMRDIDGVLSGGVYPNKYGWKPRLLIADGVINGIWSYGDPLGVNVQNLDYPRCYSYADSVSPSTLFGPVGASQGNAVKQWRNRTRRAVSDRVEVDAVWHDHEVMEHDASKVVRLDQDAGARLWITETIEQHQFGLGMSTRTTLIPL
jgi:hypothetical protein